MGWMDRIKASLGSRKDVPPQRLDPAEVLYSMPTIAGDALQFRAPDPATADGAPQFHEDEWCQLEFWPAAALTQLQRALAEYKAFELAHRLPNGWSALHVRHLDRPVLVQAPGAVQRLADQFATLPMAAPILTTSAQALGQVVGGFAIQPSSDVLLHGLADAGGVRVLGATLDGDDMQLSAVFATLHAAFGLVLVDWRQQFVLTAVEANGDFSVWQA